ncbi:MAG: hypothetical protein ACP5N7_05850 [Candidatus Pacearchaeota archaeon]
MANPALFFFITFLAPRGAEAQVTYLASSADRWNFDEHAREQAIAIATSFQHLVSVAHMIPFVSLPNPQYKLALY